MTSSPRWTVTEVLAHTDHDGPGRPPAAPSPLLTGALAGVLGVTMLGMLASDTLCPDHRAWVQGIGAVGLFAIGASIVGLMRGWAASPALAVVAGIAGVAIGVLDAVHDPTRGRLVIVAFGLATVLAAGLVVWTRRSMRPTSVGALRADAPDPRRPIEDPAAAHASDERPVPTRR